MTKSSNRVSLSRRVLKAVGSIKAMLFRRLFRSSVYESVRPTASNRLGWLETLASLVGKNSQDLHRGGVLRVSAKERAKRLAAREFRRRFVMAEQLELRTLMAADLGLDPNVCHPPIAAEVGTMVPGQVSSSQSQLSGAFFTVAAASGLGSVDASLAEGVAQATQRLSVFASSGGYSSTMREVFGRTAISDSSLSAAVAGLQSQWATGELGVRVEVLSGSSMSGAMGAFAADYQGSPAIFINGDWLASNPGADAVAKVLIEEFGHSLDRRINAGVDSPGDEGELFADRVIGEVIPSSDYSRLVGEVDAGFVRIGTNEVGVEFASIVSPLNFNENGNSLASTTGVLFITGSNQGDYVNNSTTPITYQITNVKAGDYFDFNVPVANIAGWTRLQLDLTVPVATSTQVGTSGINYTVGVSGTTTTLTFLNASRAQNNAIASAARFLSISQNPARANAPVITVTQNGSALGGNGVTSINGAVTIANRNDAPVINTTINPTLTAQGNAGAPVNGTTAGTQVSSLLTGVSDVDDLPEIGMAIVALSNTANATLWYSTNSGSTWTRVDAAGAISATSALLLSATASNRLYLQPVSNVAFSGTVLTFRAWDNTGTGVGTPGTRINVGTPTGTAPNNENSYSTATDVVDATVTPFTNNPAVVTAGATLGYTENGAASVIDNTITVTDSDSTNMSSATVSVSVGFTTGDVLAYTDANGITGSYNSGTGVLTLTGSATPAAYATALRAVTYSSTSDNPTATNSSRRIAWVVNDGNSNSTAVTSTVNVTAVNDAPTATAGGSLSYTENGAAAAIDATLTVADVDNTNLTGATVSISTNFTTGDVLGFTNQNGISGSYNSVLGVLTLTGTATVAQYQTALRSVTYRSTSDNPTSTAASRTVSWTVTDGALTSTAVTSTVNVTAVNDAPVVTAGGSLAYTENGAEAAIDTTVTVSDVDNANLTGATVTISANRTSGDVLGFTTQNGISGTYNSTSGVLTLTGTATVADYQTALRSVTYSSTSDTPTSTAASRTISWTVTDGALTSTAVTSTVNITAVNDAPTVTAGGSLSYTENGAAAVIDSTVTVSDVDSANLTGASVSISSNLTTGDILGFTNQGTISGSFNSSTGVLTLTGTATVSQYQTALRSVTFRSTSDNPTVNWASRTISWTVTDGALTSTAATSTVNITAVNDAPAVYLAGGTTQNILGQFQENGGAVQIAPSAVVSDADSTQLQSLTITLTNAQDGSSEVLTASAGSTGLVITGNNTGTLTISGSGTVADYQSVLRTVEYNNTSDNPTTSPVRTITVVARDNAGGSSLNSPTSTASVSLASINNAPVYNTGISNQTLTTGLPFSFSFPTNAFTDAENDPLTYTAQVAGGSLPSWLTFNATTRKFYGVPPTLAAPITVTVTAQDPSGATATRDFTISTVATLNGNPIASVGFATAYNLVNAPVHSNSNYYQEETNSFTTASAPYQGTNFVFFQDGTTTFSGNNVPGKLMYINSSGDVVTVPSAGIGSVSRPIKTPGNVVQGYYMWNNAGTAGSVTDDTATLLVVNPNYFTSSAVYNSSSDQVDTALNGYLTAVTFDIASASANEGTASSNNINFVVTRSSGSGTASVQFATSISGSDNASANDFVASSGTANFAAGQTSITISIATRNDAVFEPNETFTLTLTNPTVNDGQIVQGRLINATATGTIVNDEAAPTFSISNSGTEEGTPPASGNTMTFTVTRNGASAVSQSVSYGTSLSGTGEGFASADDFTSVSGTLIFAPGETTKTFTVTTVADDIVENNEAFAVGLSNATNGAAISQTNGTAVGTIEDDESTSIYSVSPASITEGGTLTFTVTRSRDVDLPQTIAFYTSTTGDTATSGSVGVGDFVGVANNVTPSGAQTLIFAPGEFSKTFNIATNQDALYEGDETFTVVLYALQELSGRATKISTFNGTAKGTIVDNDTLPVFSVVVAPADQSGVVESVGGVGQTIRFVISRTALSEATQTIDYTTVIRDSDTASDADFVPASGTLSFPSSGPESLSQTVTVTLRNDVVAESAETFGFQISNPSISASSLGTPSVAMGTILDSNQAPTTGTTTALALEDVPYVIKVSDIAYNDPESAGMASIRVKQLPDIGQLQKATTITGQDDEGNSIFGGWIAVEDEEVLSVSGPLGIGAGALRYVSPGLNVNRINLTADAFTWPSFSLQVNDGVLESLDTPTTNLGTVTINIAPVNDAPEGADSSKQAFIGDYILLDDPDFGFTDLQDPHEGQSLLGVVFTKVPELPTSQNPNKGAVQVWESESSARSGTLAGAVDIIASAYSQAKTGQQFTTSTTGSWTVDGKTYNRRMDGRMGYLYLNDTNGDYAFEHYVRDGKISYIAEYLSSSGDPSNLNDSNVVFRELALGNGTSALDGFVFSLGTSGGVTIRRTLSITVTGTATAGQFAFKQSIWRTVVTNEFVSHTVIDADQLRYSPCFCGIARHKLDGSYQLSVPTPTTPPTPFFDIEFLVRDNGGTDPVGFAQNTDDDANKISITLIDGYSPKINVTTLENNRFDEDTSIAFDGPFGNRPLFITYDPPAGAVNSLTVTVEISDNSRPGVLSLDGTGYAASVTGFDDGQSRRYRYQIVGMKDDVNAVLADLRFTPDSDLFSTADQGAGAGAGRFPPLNGIGGSEAYAILDITAKNNPEAGQIQYTTSQAHVDISVLNVNDAPTVHGSNPALSVAEDAGQSATGDTIFNWFNGNFQDLKDVEPTNNSKVYNDLDGVAVVEYTPDETTKGFWEYSETGAAGTWTALTSRSSDASAFAIPVGYRLRFRPLSNYNGSAPSLVVRLIETSANPVALGVLDVSSNGGVTRVTEGRVTLSASVTAVNDAPVATGSSSLAAVLEDASDTVGDTVSNLFLPRFNDATDDVTGGSAADAFAGIAITGYNAVATRGRWEYNNGTGWATLATVGGVSSATVIPAGSSLRFVPSANFNGQAPNITAVLIDDSNGPVSFATGVNLGTIGGTSPYSSATVVLSHSVTAVNDAPVASGSASLPAILEGNMEPSGATVAVLFSLNFSDATDNVIGGSTANTLAGVAIRSYAEDVSKGRWQYSTDNGSNWTNLSAIEPGSDVSAFALKRTDLLRFKPANDDYNSTDGGAVPSLVARLIDSSFGTLATGALNVSSNGGTTAVSSGLVTLTTSVTSVNDAPVSVDQTITVIEDTAYTLTKASFGSGTGFDDPKDTTDNNLVKVIITSLPASGTLRLNGSSVQTGDTISTRDIEEGNLTYSPAANVTGANTARVGFKVQDDGGVANGGVDTSLASYTVTINITPVNDAPTSENVSVMINEDSSHTFGSGAFPLEDATDSPANGLLSVVITSLPAVGTLKLSGADVIVGQVIPVSSIGSLVFTPNANTSGNNYARIGFKVQDDGGTANGGVDTSTSSNTVTINVDPVNDQPVATGNATLSSAFKNAPNLDGVTVSSLFGSLYSDPNDQPNPNSLTGVAITGLNHDAAKGVWQYQSAVGGDWVSLGSITSEASVTLKSTDRLRFIPANDYVGAAPELTVRLVENVTPATGGTVNLDLPGALSPTSNYSSNTSTLSHEIKGGLLVKGLADVSEGSAAVFTVSFDTVTSAVVTLALSDVTTESEDYVADFNSTSTWDSSKVNVYYFDGSTRVVLPVNGSNQVTVQSLEKFYVSVPTVNNSIYEGPEALRLDASMIGSSSGEVSTILDSGFGVVYKNDATPESSYSADNDLSVDVTAFGPVNEASDYAFFSVVGASGDKLRLAVTNGTATLVSPRIEYAVISTTTSSAQWTQYDGGSNIPTVPGGLGGGTGVVYVRVSLVSEQDDTYESSESFTLTATSITNAVKSDVDAVAILDAGNGLKYGPNISGGTPESSDSDLDDDRGLLVTSYAPVNEGSTYHMFKVTGPSGLALNLGLEAPVSGLAAAFEGFTFQYSTDKTTWTTYTWDGTSGNRPTVPAGVVNGTGEVFVRVDITSEMDTSPDPSTCFEGSEKFQLRAATVAGKSALGTGEILDDGLGGLYTGAWGATDPTTTTGALEDDRLWAINDHVDSLVLSTVTINARSNDQAVNGVTISDIIDLDPSTPNVVDSQRVVSGQGTWRVVNGNVTYSPLTTFRSDPTPISYAIRPTDRTNFSKKTASIGIDFPVGTSPDGNVPIATGTAVTLNVLSNDTFGDIPVASTLRFASTGNRDPLVVPGQGTWTINPTTNAITFTPEEGVTRDPDPIRYLVNDEDGNVSAATLVTVTYLRESRFVVQINDNYIANPTGFDVVIVDNITASGLGIAIDLGNGVTVTPNTADTDLTVGRIVWAGPVGGFSRVQVDARSKPVLTGTMADISLVTSVTSRAAANVEVRASDMSYLLNSGTYTLASPISGTNNGNVRFSEAIGLSNEPLTVAADLANASSVFNTSNTQFPNGLTNRSLSWTGARTFTLSQAALLSLGKSVRVVHGSLTRTTQLTAGGKIVETSEAVDLSPYTDWVLPGSMGLGLSGSTAFRSEPATLGLGLTDETSLISCSDSLRNGQFFAAPGLMTPDTLLESSTSVDPLSEMEEPKGGLRRSLVRGFFKRGW